MLLLGVVTVHWCESCCRGMDHDYYVPCFPRAAQQVLYGFQPAWGIQASGSPTRFTLPLQLCK